MEMLKSARRYFFTAVNTGYINNGLPDEKCCNFYHIRSGGGLHCAIVGNVVIPNGFSSNDVCAEISEDLAWKKLVNAIKARGALAGIQLASTWKGYQGVKHFSAYNRTKDISEYYTNFAASISIQNVLEAFNCLYQGTKLAIEAGFEHIQIHAAHGYLFNILIDRRFSSHADLALQLLNEWGKYLLSRNIESSIRFSMFSGCSKIDEDRENLFFDDVSKLPIDFLDASAGFYNIDKRLIYPSTPKHLKQRSEKTIKLALRYPHKKFILSGLSSHAWDEHLPQNVHIGICRDLIANPNFLTEKVNGCKKSMKCHYFSRGFPNLTCDRWNDL